MAGRDAGGGRARRRARARQGGHRGGVESGAGDAAGFPDAQYVEKGATLASRDAVLAECSLLLSVRSLSGGHDADAISGFSRATS